MEPDSEAVAEPEPEVVAELGGGWLVESDDTRVLADRDSDGDHAEPVPGGGDC